MSWCFCTLQHSTIYIPYFLFCFPNLCTNFSIYFWMCKKFLLILHTFPHSIIHELSHICAHTFSFMDVPMTWPTFNQRHLDGFERQASRRCADCAHGKPSLQLSTFHEWFSSIFGWKLTWLYYCTCLCIRPMLLIGTIFNRKIIYIVKCKRVEKNDFISIWDHRIGTGIWRYILLVLGLENRWVTWTILSEYGMGFPWGRWRDSLIAYLQLSNLTTE